MISSFIWRRKWQHEATETSGSKKNSSRTLKLSILVEMIVGSTYYSTIIIDRIQTSVLSVCLSVCSADTVASLYFLINYYYSVMAWTPDC
jgi:hypothetical protein